MGRKPVVSIGDVFEIPLTDGRKAYGQYIYLDKLGPIIRVFDYFTKPKEFVDLNKINISKLLFPPVYAGVGGAVRAGVWKVIGILSTNDYTFSGFISEISEIPFNQNEPVRIKKWFFWDGKKFTELGKILPEKYQHYESQAVYPADMIAQRIETGFDMFEYPKKFNRYMTRKELKQKYPTVKV
jgi:hypothetical protein